MHIITTITAIKLLRSMPLQSIIPLPIVLLHSGWSDLMIWGTSKGHQLNNRTFFDLATICLDLSNQPLLTLVPNKLVWPSRSQPQFASQDLLTKHQISLLKLESNINLPLIILPQILLNHLCIPSLQFHPDLFHLAFPPFNLLIYYLPLLFIRHPITLQRKAITTHMRPVGVLLEDHKIWAVTNCTGQHPQPCQDVR
jgi:hypothetical protein